MKEEDEDSPVSYRLNLVEDEEGTEGFEVAAFDKEVKLDPKRFCDELEYFIKHAREDDYKVFEQLYTQGEQLH